MLLGIKLCLLLDFGFFLFLLEIFLEMVKIFDLEILIFLDVKVYE